MPDRDPEHRRELRLPAEESPDVLQSLQAEVSGLLTFAVRLTGHLQDAEDLVQETLVRAVRSRNTFRGESLLKTWLYRIFLNVFRTWITRSRTAPDRQSVDLLETDQPDERFRDPADQISDNELGKQVAQEVSRLPERQREVIVLVHYEGCSIAETADLLQISSQNVYSILSHARSVLKQRLSHFQGKSSHEV